MKRRPRDELQREGNAEDFIAGEPDHAHAAAAELAQPAVTAEEERRIRRGGAHGERLRRIGEHGGGGLRARGEGSQTVGSSARRRRRCGHGKSSSDMGSWNSAGTMPAGACAIAHARARAEGADYFP